MTKTETDCREASSSLPVLFLIMQPMSDRQPGNSLASVSLLPVCSLPFHDRTWPRSVGAEVSLIILVLARVQLEAPPDHISSNNAARKGVCIHLADWGLAAGLPPLSLCPLLHSHSPQQQVAIFSRKTGRCDTQRLRESEWPPLQPYCTVAWTSLCQLAIAFVPGRAVPQRVSREATSLFW